MTHLLFGATLDIKGAARITNIMQHQKMSSAAPAPSDRKPTRRPGRKAPSLRPESNTSVTAGVRVVKHYMLVQITLSLADCQILSDKLY